MALILPLATGCGAQPVGSSIGAAPAAPATPASPAAAVAVSEAVTVEAAPEPCTEEPCREGEARLSARFWRCEAEAPTTQAHFACIDAERVEQERAMRAALERLARRRSPGEAARSQSLWRRAQAAECDYQAARFGDGRMADVVVMRCRLESVARRTIDLEVLVRR